MANNAYNTSLIHEELESRLLFSAGVEAVLVDDSLPGDEPAIVDTVSVNETEILQVEQTQQSSTTSEPAHEVVFIDENVDNYEQLMADLANKDNVDVYLLDTAVDGIDQISAVLANYHGLDAVHLFSHGDEQGLLLGNGSLDSDNLANYSDAISGWQSALSEQADLLIYGCDLASGTDGQALLANLQALTATDVAASDDLTGQAALGGDWDLEYQAGDIETSIVFSQDIQQNWAGVLMGGNTAPSGADNTVTTQEDTAYTFGSDDFGFTDGDGNNLLAVKITTLPGAGSLTLDGAAVTAGQSVSATDIASNKLVFTPLADANGTGYAAFTFQVQDDGGTAMGGVDLDQSPNTMTLNVTAVNDAPTGGVAITGTATEDQTLTANTATLADVDGLGAFSYTWQRDGVDIAGATAGTYTLGDADVGASITATVQYTDGDGTLETLVSGGTNAVVNVNDNPTGGISISGTATEDQTLTADSTALADADGLGAFTYTWQRDGVDISGANASTYTLGNADVGTAITATVSYTDGHGTVESITSGATAAVNTVNSASPAGTTDNGTATASPPVDNTTAAYTINPDSLLPNTIQLDSEATATIVEPSAEHLHKVNIVFNVNADNLPTVSSSPVHEDFLQPSMLRATPGEAANPALTLPGDPGQDDSFGNDSSPVVPTDAVVTMDPFLQKALDELNQQLGSAGHAAESDGRLVLTTVSGVSIILTTAYVSWAIKSGSMAAALTKTLPAWNSLDPLAVLNSLAKRLP